MQSQEVYDELEETQEEYLQTEAQLREANSYAEEDDETRGVKSGGMMKAGARPPLPLQRSVSRFLAI